MKIGQENYSLCFVIIALFFRFATAPTQTTVSEASFTYNGTEFGLFQTSPLINQPNAQTECMNWGGNLATIKSAVEDSLLLYSSPDLNTVFTCHIGLNDIDHEAGTNGDDFVWIDDSTSSYRKWGTLGMDYPITTVNFDCVRNRFRDGGLSQGWVNNPCTTERNCYFCSKPGTSNGCELTYDGSCYKVFEVSTPINWLDAQSSCAIWGGDLTSITTERENNYLNTLITSSVGNCWIGLNDRDDDGTYTWIDGTAVSYTNWTGLPPNAADSDCVQINNAGNGIWESVSCDITLNAILCKRDSPNIIPTGARFGRITNGELEFEALTGNTFFYEPLTLVCGSDGSAVVWRYSQNSNLSGSSALTETYNYVDFSWLDVDNTMQGYYRCTTSNAISHTVGVYDTTLTTVTVTGTSYTYIVGVDRTDVLLLCDPEDGDSLSTLRWSVQNGIEFFNPINLNSESSNLPDVSTSFSCKRGGVTLITTQICVKVPTISISYGVVPVTSYSSVYPAVNGLSVPSAVQDITLSINIEGKWTHPDNSNTSNSELTIPNFSSQENGVYKFYTNNWDGVEVCAIQVALTTTTTIFGVPDTQITYDNTEFGYFSDSPKIDWYTAQLRCLDWGGNLATIKSKEEDNLLFYSTDIQTHYSCYIGLNDILSEAGTDGSAYTWVDGSSGAYRNFQSGYPLTAVERDCVIFRFIQEEGGDLSVGWVDPKCSNPYNCYFCTKAATSGDCDLIYDGSCYRVYEVSTPINWLDAQSSCAIWGGDLTSISTERENNYINTLITSSVGNCWIGLNDRDDEGIYTWIDGTTVSYTNWTRSTSDNSSDFCVQINTIESSNWDSVNCEETSNTFVCKKPSNFSITDQFGQLVRGGLHFEVLQNNTILQGSITLVCSGDQASVIKWKYSRKLDQSDNEDINATYYNIEYGLSWLKVDDSKQGVYWCQINDTTSYMVSLYRHIAFPTQSSSNSSLVVTIIIILIIFIIVILIIVILIPISIFLCRKKQKSAKRPKHSIPATEGYSNYQNLSEEPSREYIELQADPNPQYMTIDESSILPLESEYQHKRDYQNLVNDPTYTGPYEEICGTDKKPNKPYENYVAMSSVKEEKKFVPRNIPIKQFPATYQQYATSRIDKDSLFSVEFVSLEEASKINVESTSDEALSNINDHKNPVKNIVSLDENRLVLDSEYFNCNYINASYIYESQFIATIHPTIATHRDFLQMIYQTEASMVIMLTTRREKAKIIGGVSNRVCYWPKKDEPIKCEPFISTLINYSETNAFIKQDISFKNTLDGKKRSFTHVISSVWNEDSTVTEMSYVVNLLNRILKQLQDDASKSIIIHCEDGISKTGIILAGINSVKELTLKKTINIFNTVKNLRKQRMKMIPTLACYTTCYSLMNEYCSIHL